MVDLAIFVEVFFKKSIVDLESMCNTYMWGFNLH
jgi:hypothetical protein